MRLRRPTAPDSAAIRAKLMVESHRQLVQDIPTLCLNESPVDGWDAILRDEAPRPALMSLLDQLDAGHSQNLENYQELNDKPEGQTNH